MFRITKNKLINVLINIYIIISTYLIIYTPPIPFVSFNVLHIIGISSWALILLNIRKMNTFFNTKSLITTIIVITGVFVYLLTVKVLNNKPILSEVSHIYWILDVIPFSIVLSLYYSRKTHTKLSFLMLLIVIGTIQSLFSLLAYMNSDFKEALVNNMIQYGYGEILNDLSSHRLFGYGSNLTYTMPIIQAVLALLTVYLGLNTNKKFFLFSPLLLFSALINARTPIIIIGIGLFLLVLNSKKPFLNLVFLIVLSILTTAIANFLIIQLEFNQVQNSAWIIDGFYEIYDFIFQGKTDGYFFSYFVNPNTYRLPDGFGLFFGVGTRSLSSDGIGVFSDIGFINDIWLGGFVYLVFSYSLVGYGIVKLYYYFKGNRKNAEAFFVLILFMAIMIANFKGVILYTNELTTICLMLYVMHFVKRREMGFSI